MLCHLIPESWWVWLTRYFNSASRRRCLESTTGPKFIREDHEQAYLYRTRHSRQKSGSMSSHHRTPSPQTRGAMIGHLPGVRKLSIEETFVRASRTSSSASSHSIPSFIREDSSPLTPTVTVPPDLGGTEGAAMPRRTSSLDPIGRRFYTCKRTSRVLVMPSLAKIEHTTTSSGSNNTPPLSPRQVT